MVQRLLPPLRRRIQRAAVSKACVVAGWDVESLSILIDPAGEGDENCEPSDLHKGDCKQCERGALAGVKEERKSRESAWSLDDKIYRFINSVAFQLIKNRDRPFPIF